MILKKKVTAEKNHIEIIKEHNLWNCYSCSGEMYKLLDTDVVKKLVDKIPQGNMILRLYFVYGTNAISNDEQFL